MKLFAMLVLVAACGSDAPHFLELACTPSPLSAAGPGPYTLTCNAEFEGSPGDARWEARGAGGVVWASGSAFIDTRTRESGKFTFALTSVTAPPVGMLGVSLFADHVQGIDGPEGDSITIQVQVVP